MSIGFLSSQADLLQFAKPFLLNRLESLSHDVQVCRYGKAPFPAMLYCFATIDLFGALLSGEASKASGVSERSRAYMQRYMGYKEEQAKLIQEVFRHKLVHLAQPNPVIVDNKGRRIAWVCDFNPNPDHLHLKYEPQKAQTPWGYPITCEYIFTVSIADLVKEIHDSVCDPGRYMYDLAQNSVLQGHFRKAVKTMLNVP